jgi:hypothetical protein
MIKQLQKTARLVFLAVLILMKLPSQSQIFASNKVSSMAIKTDKYYGKWKGY